MRNTTDKTDADIIWRLDMIKELNVFPHNLATCSPLIVGDFLFIVTSNGVDEGHINIPSPKAPSFIVLDKKTGKAALADNCARAEKIMHGQWSNPVYAEVNGKPQVIFPGGDGWLRGFDPATGRITLEVRLQPEDFRVQARRQRHEERLPGHAGRLRQQGLRRRRPGPRARRGRRPFLVHRHHQGTQEPDKDLSPVNDNFDPKAPPSTGIPPWFGTLAVQATRTKIGRNYYLRPDDVHLRHPRRFGLYMPNWRATFTASTPRPARNTGTTT